MLLLRDWAKAQLLPLPLVFCVDHGLRPASKAEAQKVVGWARKAGLNAVVLTGPLPAGGIEAAARELRYQVMGQRARAKNVAALYVAHTEDDQAETFLLRLARGSGVDGLSGMRPVSPYPHPDFPELRLVRPLLSFSRAVLRECLAAQKQAWIEDPMNDDPRFTRVRIRQAMPLLESLGVSPGRIAEAAGHLTRAREALEQTAEAVAARSCRFHEAGVLLDPLALRQAPRELSFRVLAGILMLVSANPYRPRFDKLSALFAALSDGALGGGRTLHGCRIGPAPKTLRLFGSATLLVQREKKRSARTNS
jgi:tRNA(Ile)-lysidine synthetase, N-terminal domain